MADPHPATETERWARAAVTAMAEGKASDLPRAFYARPTLEVARELLGKALVREEDGGLTGGLIVEAEAYLGQEDPASHAFRRQTPRNRFMWLGPGHTYVYRTYGMYYCLNLVTEAEGRPAAVLLRALQPLWGLDRMAGRRGGRGARLLASGPGRLCAALGLDLAWSGLDLLAGPLRVLEVGLSPSVVNSGPRVGISRAVERPWRFFVSGNPFVSGARFDRQATATYNGTAK